MVLLDTMLALLCDPHLQFVHSQCMLHCMTPVPPPSYHEVVHTHPDKAMYLVLFDEASFALPPGLYYCVTDTYPRTTGGRLSPTLYCCTSYP